MNIIKGIIIFPFWLIITLLGAIWNFVTSAIWLGILLLIIGAVVAVVQGVL